MAKKRINLYVDAEPYDKLQAVFAEMPGSPSLSSYINAMFHQMAEVLPELVARAKAGDGQAAMALMNSFYVRTAHQATTQLEEVRALIEGRGTIHTTQVEPGSEVPVLPDGQ